MSARLPPHPPFVAQPDAARILNTFTAAGAAELAARIKAAWLRCGWSIEVKVFQEPLAGYSVRLGLVNGMPDATARRVGQQASERAA